MIIDPRAKVCHLAEKSIRDVLNTGDNVTFLLALHQPDPAAHQVEERSMSPRYIKTA
jgi:hypothetical protein